jgi:hypothetical protein
MRIVAIGSDRKPKVTADLRRSPSTGPERVGTPLRAFAKQSVPKASPPADDVGRSQTVAISRLTSARLR